MPKYKKEVGEVIRIAEGQGFEVVGMTGGGHWRLKHRTGPMLTIPATPRGGNRWKKNAIADIKRTNTRTTHENG